MPAPAGLVVDTPLIIREKIAGLEMKQHVDHPRFAPRAFHLGDGGPDRRVVRSAVDKQLAQPPLSVEQFRALGPRFGEHRRQQRLCLGLLTTLADILLERCRSHLGEHMGRRPPRPGARHAMLRSVTFSAWSPPV
jgi:hypothetical protein